MPLYIWEARQAAPSGTHGSAALWSSPQRHWKHGAADTLSKARSQPSPTATTITASQILFQAPRIVQEALVRKPLFDFQCRIKSLGEKGMISGPEILLWEIWRKWPHKLLRMVLAPSVIGCQQHLVLGEKTAAASTGSCFLQAHFFWTVR